MNEKNKLKDIAEVENWRNPKFSSLAGGDINEVYLVSVASEKFVLKMNDAKRFPQMFEAERKGLEVLRKVEAIRIPKVVNLGQVEDVAYMVMEHISSSEKKRNFWEDFGQKMASLHQESAPEFGFPESNYIGSLPQYNFNEKTASEFYICQRLEPQVKMARGKGFDLGNLSSFYKNISGEIPQEEPSLIHGDLWGGNFLVDEKGDPCLIDPAVAFAPREMDIGMMHLFGGFDSQLFDAYQEIFPFHKNWKKRLAIWQLYYLLVHLNIFGAGYLGRVEAIISRYR